MGSLGKSISVSFLKPLREVISLTPSSRLKEGLRKTGIDTSLFKGHST